MGLPCRVILVIRAETEARARTNGWPHVLAGLAGLAWRSGGSPPGVRPDPGARWGAVILGQAWRAAAQVERGIAPEQLAEVVPEATRVGEVTGEPAAAPAYRDDELIGYIFHPRGGAVGRLLRQAARCPGRARPRRADHRRRDPRAERADPRDRGVARGSGAVRRPVSRRGRARAGRGRARRARSRRGRCRERRHDLLGGDQRCDHPRRARRRPRPRRVRRDSDRPFWLRAARMAGAARRRLARAPRAERRRRAGGARARTRLYPAGAGPEPDATLAELYFGLATPARIGRNLLGERCTAKSWPISPKATS